MVKRKYFVDPSEICENWRDSVLVLWVEDDAMVPDKERTSEAFRRMSGISEKEKPVKVIDEGDLFAAFYRDGWVKIVSCEGGEVGVVVQ